MGTIYVGTCNWADFKDWYPAGLRTSDRLRYYARHFSIVEIDATFYALMPRRNFESWAAATPPEFVFDVKAYRTLTCHGDAYESGLARNAAGSPGNPPSEHFDQFIWQIQPLRDAGKLRAIQFQFPPWFEYSRASLEHIARCRAHLTSYLMAIEFRHSSWLEPSRADQTFAFLREQEIVYTIADEPQVGTGTVPPTVAVTNPVLAVIRFHGRNAEKWRARGGESGRDRYDYAYQAEELLEWADIIQDLATRVSEVHVLMNNNVQGQGLVNGPQLRRMLTGAIVPVDAASATVQTAMTFEPTSDA